MDTDLTAFESFTPWVADRFHALLRKIIILFMCLILQDSAMLNENVYNIILFDTTKNQQFDSRNRPNTL